ncbi:hypothetical protein DFH06DRAFT_71861 [Mycena polygramma]|nr:hypothetical protein DFH06DRAFT_71861 [Mycena polygramma]
MQSPPGTRAALTSSRASEGVLCCPCSTSTGPITRYLCQISCCESARQGTQLVEDEAARRVAHGKARGGERGKGKGEREGERERGRKGGFLSCPFLYVHRPRVSTCLHKAGGSESQAVGGVSGRARKVAAVKVSTVAAQRSANVFPGPAAHCRPQCALQNESPALRLRPAWSHINEHWTVPPLVSRHKTQSRTRRTRGTYSACARVWPSND